MSVYTPSTGEVRRRYAYARSDKPRHKNQSAIAEFVRWLAAHDAEVLATAALRRPARTEPTPFNGKWVCGKCDREVAQGVDDGQIPEHHRTCPKRAQTEPTDAQVEAGVRALYEYAGLEVYPDEMRVVLKAAFAAGQEEQS